MSGLLDGKVALVTGGGGGLGWGIAKRFAIEGAKLVIAEISPENARRADRELKALGCDAIVEVVDVRDAAQVEALAAQVFREYGHLDVLVNNVGDFLGFFKPLEESTEAEWDALYAINVRQVYIVLRAMIPLLKAAGAGSIINMSSVEGHRGLPNAVPYVAMKAAITGLTRSLATELAPFKIRANEIPVETTESETVRPFDVIQPQYRDRVPFWVPLGRFGNLDDAAGCALFLASDLSAWVTATSLHMNGGTLAAGGYYRAPSGEWTNLPVIVDSGFGDMSHLEKPGD